ncbi:ATP-binding cassette domain-containing protein [Myxococcota bacterium]|nr:ATP-binding cassette domain-containing protein [Myxococcota bacterium]
MSEADPLSVEVEGLSHTTADGFVLRLPRWTVSRGAQVAVLGPSGSGKTTLLRLLAGLILPTSGRLLVEGLVLTESDEAARRAHRQQHVALLQQDSPVMEALTVEENVLLPFRLSPGRTLDEAARDRARRLLLALGLGGLVHRGADRLSAGERQRVALARALVVRPRLLLCDEATASLDPAAAARSLNLTQTVCDEEGLTLLWVTHDLGLAARLPQRLLLGGEA